MGCVSSSAADPGRRCETQATTPPETVPPPVYTLPSEGGPRPTLLESTFLGRTPVAHAHEVPEDSASVASSRLSSITGIATPSNVPSNFESLAISSNRPEFDKDSGRDVSIYAASAHSERLSERPGTDRGTDRASDRHRSVSGFSGGGTGTSVTQPPSTRDNVQEDCESFCGSIAESRMDSQAYLQEVEAGRIPEETEDDWCQDTQPVAPPPAVLRIRPFPPSIVSTTL